MCARSAAEAKTWLCRDDHVPAPADRVRGRGACPLDPSTRAGFRDRSTNSGELSGRLHATHLLPGRRRERQADAPGYERLVTLAGQTISGDYELAELLIAISKTQPLTDAMQAGLVTAAKSISSDYERHRVLTAALARPRAHARDAVGDALTPRATSARDYELAGLLIELNHQAREDRRRRAAGVLQGGKLTVVRITSTAAVLDAAVSRQMTPAMIADVLGSPPDRSTRITSSRSSGSRSVAPLAAHSTTRSGPGRSSRPRTHSTRLLEHARTLR